MGAARAPPVPDRGVGSGRRCGRVHRWRRLGSTRSRGRTGRDRRARHVGAVGAHVRGASRGARRRRAAVPSRRRDPGSGRPRAVVRVLPRREPSRAGRRHDRPPDRDLPPAGARNERVQPADHRGELDDDPGSGSNAQRRRRPDRHVTRARTPRVDGDRARRLAPATSWGTDDPPSDSSRIRRTRHRSSRAPLRRRTASRRGGSRLPRRSWSSRSGATSRGAPGRDAAPRPEDRRGSAATDA